MQQGDGPFDRAVPRIAEATAVAFGRRQRSSRGERSSIS